LTPEHPRGACGPCSGARLNGDCHSAKIDRAALQRALQKQGWLWHGLVTERCQHLFADAPVFIAPAQMQQMREVIDAVERVVALPGWERKSQISPASAGGNRAKPKACFTATTFISTAMARISSKSTATRAADS